MADDDAPTPITGERLAGVERVLARSDETIARAASARLVRSSTLVNSEALAEIELRLGRAEDKAAAAEAEAHAARQDVRDVRAELVRFGGRLSKLEEFAESVAARLARIEPAVYKGSALAIAGGAAATAILHALGLA